MWSNPGYHRSQHHPNQRFFLGDPESITRYGFTISFSESTCWNIVKYRLPYHFSTRMKPSLITQFDQTLSFSILKWCNLKMFFPGPCRVHQIWPVENTLENPTPKIVHFGPSRVILGPEILILRVNITFWHQILSYSTLIPSFQRNLVYPGRLSLAFIMETIRRT